MIFQCPNCRVPIALADAPGTPLDHTEEVVCPSCHSRFPLSVSDSSAVMEQPSFGVGRFEIRATLGRGGGGVVYKAWDQTLERLVALKVPHPGRVTRQVGAQILREAKTLAAIRHPNVVQVYEAGLDGDTWWIATELIDGISLQEQLAISVPGHRQAAQMMVTLLRATQSFHDRGITHRDLKPGNILLDGSQTPHITDFGLASHRVAPDVTVTQDGKVFGTYAYMSPEQAAGEVSRIGPASDIYSLGVVLYELLTGIKPFQATDSLTVLHLIRHVDPKLPRRVQPDIPRDLQTICLKALSKKPEERFESAGAMADELQRFLDDRPILSRPPGLAIRFVKLVRRNRLVSALLTAVGLIAAALIAMALQPPAGTVPVTVSTSPPEAQVSLIRYDPVLRVPHDSGFIQSGASGRRFHLIPGLYRIRAETADGRYHEVWRHVPESAARNSTTQLFPHASWTVVSGDIVLPTITLWRLSDIQEPLIEVAGGTFQAGYESASGSLSAAHPQSVPDLLVGKGEVTYARFRSVLNQPIPGGSMTYLQFVDDKYGKRDADENSSVSGYPVDVAILWCELAGVRLPTTIEWEFVATDRGQMPNAGTGAEPPARQPWSDGSADPIQGIPPSKFQSLHSGLAEFTDSMMLGYLFLFPEAFPGVSPNPLPDGFRLPRVVEVRGAPPTWIGGGNPPFEYFARERAAAPMEEGLLDSDVEPKFRRIGWRAFRSKVP